MEGEIVNRVAASGIITIDPADFYPADSLLAQIDLAPLLWQGAIMREKDLRNFAATHNWESYAGKGVAIHWPDDVIIPKYVSMLIAAHLQPYAAFIYFGTSERLAENWAAHNVATDDLEQYRNRIVVIKGCGDREIADMVYGTLANRLVGLVKTLMYGEACSTVPVYKAPKKLVPPFSVK